MQLGIWLDSQCHTLTQTRSILHENLACWFCHSYVYSLPISDWQEMHDGNSSTGSWNFQVRRSQISDKSKGFIELLLQLSVCDSVPDEDFEEQFQELSSLEDDHVISVIEDESCGKTVTTGSVFIVKKFMRSCSKVGHVEDVVADSGARGLQLGKKVVAFLTDHARSMGCCKVILSTAAWRTGILWQVRLQAGEGSYGSVVRLTLESWFHYWLLVMGCDLYWASMGFGALKLDRSAQAHCSCLGIPDDSNCITRPSPLSAKTGKG